MGDADECAAWADLICEGGPPDDLNLGNVCSSELCAIDQALSQKCEDFLGSCIADGFGERECVTGAYLICRENGV